MKASSFEIVEESSVADGALQCVDVLCVPVRSAVAERIVEATIEAAVEAVFGIVGQCAGNRWFRRLGELSNPPSRHLKDAIESEWRMDSRGIWTSCSFPCRR